jgi:hypothetical protein
MSRTATAAALSLAVVATTLTAQELPSPTARAADAPLDRLVGRWRVAGDVRGGSRRFGRYEVTRRRAARCGR